jgi:predicted transposase YbfD/YdcC
VEETGPSIIAIFRDLPDPRVDRTKLHALGDIVTIAILAVIAGADAWTEIEDYGRSKRAWLATFLALENGIPSHDTFGRIFSKLDPQAFRECFATWVGLIREQAGGEVGGQQVAIDGKTSRRTGSKRHRLGPLHLVSAWACEDRLVLGQLATSAKSNEITAIPDLLDLIEVKGSVVTIDAQGCQRKIASAITDKGGDYVLAVKDNQPELHEDIRLFFEWAERAAVAEAPEVDVFEQSERGHGRVERRRTSASGDVAWIRASEGPWKGLSSIAMVERWRRVGDVESYERRFYACSVEPDAESIAGWVRGHWGIENRLHWSLDVAMREDESRVRTGHAAENLSILRHLALNLLKHETTCKRGIKGKRARAGWDDSYLLKVLGV